MTNGILWGDSPDEIVNDESAAPTVSFSDVEGGLGEGTIDVGGNINADPRFVDADLRLSAGSPCIDSADSASYVFGSLVDLDGAARAVDDPSTPNTGVGAINFLDMGAYEFQGSAGPGFDRADFDEAGDVDLDDCALFQARFNGA